MAGKCILFPLFDSLNDTIYRGAPSSLKFNNYSTRMTSRSTPSFINQKSCALMLFKPVPPIPSKSVLMIHFPGSNDQSEPVSLSHKPASRRGGFEMTKGIEVSSQSPTSSQLLAVTSTYHQFKIFPRARNFLIVALAFEMVLKAIDASSWCRVCNTNFMDIPKSIATQANERGYPLKKLARFLSAN